MEINPIAKLENALPVDFLAAKPQNIAAEDHPQSFKELLKSALDSVQSLQTKADDSVKSLASGGAVDLHEVMIDLEQASLAMELTLQIRNKLMDAYKEITSMQV